MDPNNFPNAQLSPNQDQPGSPAPATPASSPSSKPKEQAESIPTAPKFPTAELASVSQNADQIAKSEGDEYWENYAREIELEKKILEMGGVEKIESGEVPISENLAKEMGVKPTVTAETPMAKVSGFSVSDVSLTDDQLTTGLAKPASSGFRWLVEWFIYQLLKAHYLVRRIKGRILRQKAGS